MVFFQIKLQLNLPKTGFEPMLVSYKETVLPIKLFRLEIYEPFQGRSGTFSIDNRVLYLLS